MTSDFNVQVDDLVLFLQGPAGPPDNRWLPMEIYSHKALQVRDLDATAPGWQRSMLAEVAVGADGRFFVANFGLLKPPPMTPPSGPDDLGDQVTQLLRDLSQYSGAKPQDGDLLIVPYTDSAAAAGFLVPQALYKRCPTLPDNVVADVEFMAVQEGVVLANLPKFEWTGVSCYLLSLSNLRNAALPAAKPADKSEHARMFSRMRVR